MMPDGVPLMRTSVVGGIDFAAHDWADVVEILEQPLILDLSRSSSNNPAERTTWTIGRYDEVRPDLYTTPLFGGVRNVHMGLDIGGPVGTAVMAFAAGEVSHFGYNAAAGDYGHTVITKHCLDDVNLWALHGHLDAASTANKQEGQVVHAGETIGWFGAKNENGGWEPHLHFQLSFKEPTTYDLPGVVSEQDRPQALLDFPDPRLILGPLY
jgi:murein DD-endopeptidase MepM/ murein hydrolase activator NlpD